MANSRSQKSRAKILLEGMLRKAPHFEATVSGQKVNMYVCKIGPDLADQIIEHANSGNRKIRQKKVAEYERHMKRDEWMLRAPLEFLTDGRLHDGQHRLRSVRESGKEVVFLVQLIPETKAHEASRFTDIGVPRNLPDYLHFNGVMNSSRTSPILVLERNFRITTCPFQASPGERVEYLDLYREIREETFKRTFDVVPDGMHRKLGVRRDFLDWFALQFIFVDRDEEAHLFLQYIDSPVQEKKTSPMFVLNEQLTRMMNRRKEKKIGVSTVEQGAMIVKGWNLYYEQKPATPAALRYRPNDDWPLLKGAH